MRKRDLLTPSGITLGFIMIMLAIISSTGGSDAGRFVDLACIFIVIGGVAASLLINFKFDQIKQGYS